MHIKDLYNLYLQNPSVETDTRKIKSGDIFFALKGPNFNGNDYVISALSQGASYCIVDEYLQTTDSRIIQVTNCLEALQELAKMHRQQFSIPFIAITGSNGKTTTKELVHAVLSSSYICYTTIGNLNNHIGVPLTILRIKKDAEFAVIEMGANHQKEIESYCTYTMPTHGLITNCGKAHLEGFGGEAGVKKGKGELFDYLRNHNGAAFIFQDFDYLKEMSKGIKHVITYGTDSQFAQYSGTVLQHSELLNVRITSGVSFRELKTNLVGDYNLPNVLAAVAIGKYFKVPDDKIKKALENYTPSNSRSQLIEKEGMKIILDAYNANPSSMKVAVENFAAMNGTNKVLMLGGMMELGNESIEEHKSLVKLISAFTWHKVVLVGNDFKDLPTDFIHFTDVTTARNWYREQHFKNSQVLIKGSRSMQMEKVLE